MANDTALLSTRHTTSITSLLLFGYIVCCLCISTSIAQDPTYAHALRSQHPTLANPAVVAASVVDSMLPKDYMRASRIYRNPKTAGALAQASWFTDQEMPVLQREADRIPREQVYKLIRNAGFLEH